MRLAPTLASVKGLRMTHDEASDPEIWPTPEEELNGRKQNKKRRGDSRDRGTASMEVVAARVAAAKLGETR